MLRKKPAKLEYVSVPKEQPVAEYVPHPVIAKLHKAVARAPLSEHEQLVLARLVIRAIAEGARSDLREIAQAAVPVVGA